MIKIQCGFPAGSGKFTWFVFKYFNPTKFNISIYIYINYTKNTLYNIYIIIHLYIYTFDFSHGNLCDSLRNLGCSHLWASWPTWPSPRRSSSTASSASSRQLVPMPSGPKERGPTRCLGERPPGHEVQRGERVCYR